MGGLQAPQLGGLGQGGGITPAGGTAGQGFGAFQIWVSQAQDAINEIQRIVAEQAPKISQALSSALSGTGGGGGGGAITPAGGGGGSFGPFQTLVNQAQEAFANIIQQAGPIGGQISSAISSGLQQGGEGGQAGGGITPAGGAGGSFGPFQTLVNQAQEGFQNIVEQAGPIGGQISAAIASGLQQGGEGGQAGGGITPAGGAGGSFGPFQTLVNMAQEAFANIIQQAGPIGGQISAAIVTGLQQGGEGGQAGGGITPAGGAGGSFGPFQTLVNQAQEAFANIIQQAGPIGGQISAAIASGLQQGGEGGQAGGGITPAGGAGGSFGPFQTLVNQAQEGFANIVAASRSSRRPDLCCHSYWIATRRSRRSRRWRNNSNRWGRRIIWTIPNTGKHGTGGFC